MAEKISHAYHNAMGATKETIGKVVHNDHLINTGRAERAQAKSQVATHVVPNNGNLNSGGVHPNNNTSAVYSNSNSGAVHPIGNSNNPDPLAQKTTFVDPLTTSTPLNQGQAQAQAQAQGLPPQNTYRQ